MSIELDTFSHFGLYIGFIVPCSNPIVVAANLISCAVAKFIVGAYVSLFMFIFLQFIKRPNVTINAIIVIIIFTFFLFFNILFLRFLTQILYLISLPILYHNVLFFSTFFGIFFKEIYGIFCTREIAFFRCIFAHARSLFFGAFLHTRDRFFSVQCTKKKRDNRCSAPKKSEIIGAKKYKFEFAKLKLTLSSIIFSQFLPYLILLFLLFSLLSLFFLLTLLPPFLFLLFCLPLFPLFYLPLSLFFCLLQSPLL